MKQLLIIGLLCLAIGQVAAQVGNVDSLVNVLETQKLTAEETKQLCILIVASYQYNNYEKAILYAERGLKLAKEEQDYDWMSQFTRCLGSIFANQGKFELALLTLEKAAEYAKKSKIKEEENMVAIYIGNMYNIWGKYEQSLKYLIEVLPSLETLQQYRHYANTLINIAIIYRYLINNEKALEYCEKAITVAEKHNLDYPKMVIFNVKGEIFHSIYQEDSALVYLLKAHEMSSQLNEKSHRASISQNLAKVYSSLEEYNLAEKYANECLELAVEIGNQNLLFSAWYVMSNIRFEQRRYRESEMYALKIWETDSTDLFWARNVTSHLCKVNIYLNNHEKAMYYLEKYGDVRNDISSKELFESIAEMEVKYETEKKDMQIASLEKERQLYFWLGIAGVLLAVALGIVLLQNIRNRRKERCLIASESIQEGEIGERIRIAEDLHDRLGGSLSAVKMGLNNAESLQSISDKIDACMKEVREITNNVMPRSLRLFGMKGALEDFCTQFSNLQFHFFGDDARIRHNQEYTVYCCARELVNNAQKHAGASTVNLQLVQSRKHVSLTVQDDGCGFDERTVVKGDGLQNIRNRVASCRGKMDIVSSPGKGTETVIELGIER